MRTNLYSLIILSISFLLINCSETTKFSKNSIQNSWMLKNVTGGLQGLQLDYSGEEVNWTFYDNNTVKIDNYTSSNTQFFTYVGFVTGTYPYEIKMENNQKILYINHLKQGMISIKDEQLLIDDEFAADGILKTFQLILEE